MSFGLEVWNKEGDKIFDLDHKYVTILGTHLINNGNTPSHTINTYRFTLPIPPNVDPFVYLDTATSEGFLNVIMPTRENLELYLRVRGALFTTIIYGFTS